MAALNPSRIGIEIPVPMVVEVLSNIEQAERLGIHAVWLTTGGPKTADNNIRRDTPSILAAAAARTTRILLGTAIVLTWPRHPLSFVEYCEAMGQLAPGRFRLGVGPGNKAPIERTYGFEYKRPLGHLEEYVRIIRSVLRGGAVDFNGQHYRAQTADNEPVDVPVMISAVRRKAFELAGAHTDGAISWICPGSYLRDFGLPAMAEGAKKEGRSVPPLIAHVAVSVHENWQDVQEVARHRFDSYMRRDTYVEMFETAGFPEARNRVWSDPMLQSIVISGDAAEVGRRLRELFAFGAAEIMVSVLPAGENPEASRQRTLSFLGRFARSLDNESQSGAI
jgi:alkanesulfonate monooxygenase SsuD/methylene tetrahydromethanopterin reductase-like flavin-dependent oxidoreductase (luciferase family)